MDKQDVLDVVRDQINELRGISLRSATDRENFEMASWPYLQAYEMGIQKVLKQLEEFIKI